MSDLISRQAAIAEFSCCELTPDGGIDVNYAIDFLECMPSAQPERGTGRWLPDTRTYQIAFVCSKCKKSFNVDTINLKPQWSYCPNCGADMRGDNNEID